MNQMHFDDAILDDFIISYSAFKKNHSYLKSEWILSEIKIKSERLNLYQANKVNN